jgi:hypothetical protein
MRYTLKGQKLKMFTIGNVYMAIATLFIMAVAAQYAQLNISIGGLPVNQ